MQLLRWLGGRGHWSAIILLLATPACNKHEESPKPSGRGGNEDSGLGALPSCSLGLRLSGDLQTVLRANEEVTCSPVDSVLTGIDVIYVTPEVSSIALRISDVTEGQIGSFPAGVNIVLTDNRRYETSLTGCTVDIVEHRRTGSRDDSAERRAYQVAGTGTCRDATTDGGPGSITIGDLTFRIPAVWRD